MYCSGAESAATEEDPPSSTTPASTVAPDELGVTVPPVDPDLLPTTTADAPVVRPLPPPPTTPEGWVLSPGEGRVAVPAAEMAIRIVGVQPSGRVVELDTATGDLATTELDMGVGMPSGIYAGADWILVTSPDSTGGRLLFTDAFYTGPDKQPLNQELTPDLLVDERSRTFLEKDVPMSELILKRGVRRLLGGDEELEQKVA